MTEAIYYSMKRIYLIMLLLGCSLTTTMAQSERPDLENIQGEIRQNVEKLSSDAPKIQNRAKELLDIIDKYTNGHRDIDLAYINLPFDLMSVETLEQMRDFYATEEDMLALIDARIELCAKVAGYNKLLNSDFDINGVSDALSCLYPFILDLPNQAKKYSLTDEQTQNIKAIYGKLLAYYDAISAICDKLIPEVERYRDMYGNRSDAFRIVLSRYIVKREWKTLVNEYIIKVPYLNNLYNNYISALYNNPTGSKTIELEARFKRCVGVK